MSDKKIVRKFIDLKSNLYKEQDEFFKNNHRSVQPPERHILDILDDIYSNY